jgi:hypothetical protein
MDSHTDTRPISRLEIVDTGRRRRWPDEVKVRIVEEMRRPILAMSVWIDANRAKASAAASCLSLLAR